MSPEIRPKLKRLQDLEGYHSPAEENCSATLWSFPAHRNPTTNQPCLSSRRILRESDLELDPNDNFLFLATCNHCDTTFHIDGTTFN